MSKQQIDEAELAIYGRLNTLTDEDREEVLNRISNKYGLFNKIITGQIINEPQYFFDSIEDMKKHSIIPVQDLQGPTFPLDLIKFPEGEAQDEQWFNNLPIGS